MTCYGTRHVWTHMTASGNPPHGMACCCGGFTWMDDTGVGLANDVMPSGICPRCKRAWDDHSNGVCPLNWPGKVAET